MSVEKGLRHLAKVDPVMRKLIPQIPSFEIVPTDDYFRCLVNSIISQLVSSKAADTVSARLHAHVSDLVDPATLLKIDTETYRSFGIGPQKSGYIRNVAQAFTDQAHLYEKLHELEDHEVVQRLTDIRGVGKWTAEMFLIFGLGRMDVFAPDDLGLKNAMIRHFGIGETPSRKDLVAFAERWSPYRSVASVVLWRSLSL
jgi:DNA-3-methyladenine glycosylase II